MCMDTGNCIKGIGMDESGEMIQNGSESNSNHSILSCVRKCIGSMYLRLEWITERIRVMYECTVLSLSITLSHIPTMK